MKKCSVKNCGKTHSAKGFCEAHYYRFKRNGHPLAGKTGRGVCIAGFYDLLSSQTDDCIRWKFGYSSTGYGVVSFAGKATPVHRAVCAHVHGKPPKSGLDAAHSCGNRWCVNHRHLRWATRSQNAYDRHIQAAKEGKVAPNAKLSKSDVLKIKDMIQSKVPIKRIAREHHVNPKTIRCIRDGVTWTWVN